MASVKVLTSSGVGLSNTFATRALLGFAEHGETFVRSAERPRVYRTVKGALLRGSGQRDAMTRDDPLDISEDQLITAIGRVLSGTGPDVLVPVGDDAAVVRAGTGDLVLTTDALVEGTHFDRAMSTPRDIGYKAIAVSLSDIAAMAGSPRYALCALNLSDDVDAGWAMELFGGMREASDEFACTLIGGNLALGPEVTVAITVTGEVARGAAVRRSGAQPEDVVVVTGTLGGAAAGRRLARRGAPWTEDELDAIRRFERPAPRVGEAPVLARNGATAMIDVSDGLTRDLVRICEASGVGVRLDPATVPAHPAAAEGEALGGGEDYELLATMPSVAAVADAAGELAEMFATPLTAIGTIVVEGLQMIDIDGVTRPLEPAGWNHFG